MSEYYTRSGKPLTFEQWLERTKAGDRDERRVAETTLENGYWVSTVYMGLNHQYGDGPPLIFECMVFSKKRGVSDLDCDRYSTEAEAKAGHEAMCAKWADKPPYVEDEA